MWVTVLTLAFALSAPANGQPPTPSEWLSPNSAIDIRQLAPPRPAAAKATIAQPQSGSNLQDLGGDWFRRQIHLSTNGADDDLMSDLNHRLERLFEDPTVDTHDRAPASRSQIASAWSRPRRLHMTKFGAFQMHLGTDLQLDCDFMNGNELTLTKPLFQDIDLRLNHQNTLNSVRLNFSW